MQNIGNTTAPTRLISLNEACHRTGKSRWWIMAKEKAGEFPKSITVGYRKTMFVEAEVEAWIQALIATRETGRAA